MRWPAELSHTPTTTSYNRFGPTERAVELFYYDAHMLRRLHCIIRARRELNQPAKLNLRDGRDWCEFVCGGYKTNKLAGTRAGVLRICMCGSAMYGISVRSFVRQVI